MKFLDTRLVHNIFGAVRERLQRAREKSMTENFLRLFANESNVVTLAPGQTLFNKGDAGHQMFVVKSGEVQIVDGPVVFEVITPGGIFGEMALISKDPRSATAKAKTESVVIPVDEKRFLYLVQQTPLFALRVMDVMSARLRAMNARIASSS
jgi:CRP/FNR family transcriptional regulator, cyclic AMP receptor protein